MTFVDSYKPEQRLDGVAYRDPLMRHGGGRRRGMSGLGASTGTQIATGAGAVGASVAAGSAIAAGAALGSVVPILGTAIGALVGFASTFIGQGTPDQMKNIWSQVPLAVIRLTGGHGTWTDPLTHEVLTDAQSDLRKSAVVASAIGAFNDSKNFWYDTATQSYITGATALQRWQQRFGSLTFANAYAAYPSAFQVYSPVNSVGDPSIHSPGVAGVPLAGTPPATGPASASSPSVTSVNATPAQVAAAGAVPVSTSLQASILGGLSGNTGLILAGGVILAVLFARRGSSSSEAA